MITVTRLNGQDITLNPDHIVSVETTPDAVLTLMSGEKLVLRNNQAEVVERFIAYKRTIHNAL